MKPKKKKKKEQTDNNEDTQNQEEGQSDLQKFVQTALRQPRGGIYEQLLSQFLAQAVIVTDPLKRIKIVCEAALLIPEKERGDLAVDYEQVNMLNRVANALLNSVTRKDLDFGVDVVSIPWGFGYTEENFKEFIEPWVECQPNYWPYLLKKHVEFSQDRYGQVKIVKIIETPTWSFLYEVCACLTHVGYNTVKNAFAAWAIPKVQLYLAELTQVVSPSLYAEVIGLYRRNSKGSYAEKVKEAAKPVEAPADET